jgi:hypothetical protein
LGAVAALPIAKDAKGSLPPLPEEEEEEVEEKAEPCDWLSVVLGRCRPLCWRKVSVMGFRRSSGVCGYREEAIHAVEGAENKVIQSGNVCLQKSSENRDARRSNNPLNNPKTSSNDNTPQIPLNR